MNVLRTLTAVHSGLWPVVDAIVRVVLRDSRRSGGYVERLVVVVILETYKKFDVMRKCGIKLRRMHTLELQTLSTLSTEFRC